MAKSLQGFLKTADPLSDEAISAVVDAREENTHVDFKLDLENVDPEWLEVTKDVMSFANMEGGYLVFGVKNGSYENVGLSDESVKRLSDTNNLIQKFNKCVEPPFTTLRAKVLPRRRDRKDLLKELDRIAKSAQTEWSGKPARADALLARNIDSCLYAQDDYPDLDLKRSQSWRPKRSAIPAVG